MEKLTQRKSLSLSLLLGVSIVAVTAVGINSLKGFTLISRQGEEVEGIIEIKTVTALGRIEPQGEIIHVNVPYSRQGSRLEKLLVREGDNLQKGQVIAILDSNSIALNTVEEGEERVIFTAFKIPLPVPPFQGLVAAAAVLVGQVTYTFIKQKFNF